MDVKNPIICDVCPIRGVYGESSCAFIHAGDEKLCEIYKRFGELELKVKQLNDLMAICNNDNMQFEKRNIELEEELAKVQGMLKK